jgi:hypothetical protein
LYLFLDSPQRRLGASCATALAEFRNPHHDRPNDQTAAVISNANHNGMSHRASVGQKPTVTDSPLDSTKLTSTIRNSTAISGRIGHLFPSRKRALAA